MKRTSAKSLIPFACFLASVAFVLPLALFAISSSLSLRSFRTPSQSALGYVTHAFSVALLVLVPSLLALRPTFRWRWAVVAIVAVSAGFAISLHFLPHLRATGVVTSSSSWVFFLVGLALMVVSALLAPATRASAASRRWTILSLEVLAYVCVVAGAFLFTSIPLYIE